MSTFTIDGVNYDLETLSPEAKEHIASIQFVDTEIARISAQAAALQTARIAYGNELKKHLEALSGDTIKFN